MSPWSEQLQIPQRRGSLIYLRAHIPARLAAAQAARVAGLLMVRLVPCALCREKAERGDIKALWC